MITYIAHMRIPPENAVAYEAALADMARKVTAHEPGVIHYALSKSVDDPDLYMVIEVYRDEAAFQAHWGSDYIRPSVALTKPLIEEGSLKISRYESV